MVTSPVPVDPVLLSMQHAMSSSFYKRGLGRGEGSDGEAWPLRVWGGVRVFLECCTMTDKEGEARLYLG